MCRKLLLTLVAVLFPLSTLAASIHLVGDYFLKGSEKAVDDVYALARDAVFGGIVQGDAVALSERIRSDGEISADALFVGESVTLGGAVGDDARLVGRSVIISGAVGDDVVAIASSVTAAPEASVGGNLYAVGGRVTLDGEIHGSVRALAKRTEVLGAVDGSVEVWGDLSLGDGARIGGDLIYHAPRERAVMKEQVGGEVIFVRTAREGAGLGRLHELASGLFSLQILSLLALGFLLLALARERTEEVLIDVSERFWPRVLRGLLIAFVTPLAAALLFASVVGAAAGVVAVALFLAAFPLSLSFSGLLVGGVMERLLFKRSPFPLHSRPVLLGTVVFALLSVVPYVGPAVALILILASLGSIGTVFYRHLKEVK